MVGMLFPSALQCRKYPQNNQESKTAERGLGFVASVNIRLFSVFLAQNVCLSDFVLTTLCLTRLTLHMAIDILQDGQDMEVYACVIIITLHYSTLIPGLMVNPTNNNRPKLVY